MDAAITNEILRVLQLERARSEGAASSSHLADNAEAAMPLGAADPGKPTVRVDVNVRGEVWIDQRRTSSVPATLRLPAGRHLIEVRAVLHESAHPELTLAAGSSYRLQLTLSSLSDYRGLSPGYFYVSLGLTRALLATAALLGANGLAVHACPISSQIPADLRVHQRHEPHPLGRLLLLAKHLRPLFVDPALHRSSIPCASFHVKRGLRRRPLLHSAALLQRRNEHVVPGSEINGSSRSARATRTFSRAATSPMPHFQLSQWAQDAMPKPA